MHTHTNTYTHTILSVPYLAAQQHCLDPASVLVLVVLVSQSHENDTINRILLKDLIPSLPCHWWLGDRKGIWH